MVETSTGGTNVGVRWQTLLLVGLSLSIGWGIRGNFGHEYGAMIPGALAGLAGAFLGGGRGLDSGWAFFLFFCGVGLSFGGGLVRVAGQCVFPSGHSGAVVC